jgi:hypothetical protein
MQGLVGVFSYIGHAHHVINLLSVTSHQTSSHEKCEVMLCLLSFCFWHGILLSLMWDQNILWLAWSRHGNFILRHDSQTYLDLKKSNLDMSKQTHQNRKKTYFWGLLIWTITDKMGEWRKWKKNSTHFEIGLKAKVTVCYIVAEHNRQEHVQCMR